MTFIETPVYLIFVLSIVLFLSEWASRKPRLKAFGIALLVLVLGAVFSNVGLLPSRANPTYDFIFEYVAPASLFLMLLDVNLTQLKKTGLPILILFLLGSLGTVLGVFIATLVIKDGPLFEGLYPALAGMLAGTYTGGSINFNAVALHYRVMDQGLVYTSAVAADNVVTTLWFFVTIAVPVFLGRWFPLKKLKTRNADTGDSPEEGQIEIVEDDSARLNIQSLSLWIGLSALGLLGTALLTDFFKTKGWNIPGMIIITTLALLLAQIPVIHRQKGNMFLGSWGVYLFLAVVGAFCDFSALGEAGALAILLLGFIGITMLGHGLIVFIGCYLLKYDWDMAAIASQANIGGGTTAMALAKNFGRNELILPSILIGSLGNALGTYLGFMVAGLL
ncbi:DUF819 domain-containing protein [Robiginitalea sp.]|uniref:DUF819 family protein n=2 Tax=Robiginitalea sp. TaxID=1902411 RepID=UPI003C7128A5